MALSEADTRAKLIDPAIHLRGWTEDLIRRAEAVGAPFAPSLAAPYRCRAVNAPHLVVLVRAGAVFENGKLVERPDESGGEIPAA